MLGIAQLGDPIIIFGSQSALVQTGETLTNSYTGVGAVVSPTIRAEGVYAIAIDLTYAMGAAETSNTAEVKIEGSHDGTNWYQFVNDATSSGVSTIDLREFKLNGEGSYHLPIIDVFTNYLRLSAKETGVSSNYGTIFGKITLLGSNK